MNTSTRKGPGERGFEPDAATSRDDILGHGWVWTAAEAAQSKRSHAQLLQLYAIGTTLTQIERVEDTLGEVLALVSATSPLRTAILLLDDPHRGGSSRAFLWHVAGVSRERIRSARNHANTRYAYLAGSMRASSIDTEIVALLPGEGGDEAASKSGTSPGFVLLPLVVDHQGIFGALQLEGMERFDEADLMFVDAVVRHLSIAIDRLAVVHARQADADARRLDAETTTVTALKGEQVQRRLSQISAQLALSLDERDTYAVVVQAAVPLLGELCILDVLDDDGRVQRLDVVFAEPGHDADADRLRAIAPTSLGPESDRPQLVPELTAECAVHDRAHAALLAAIGGRSAMILPMVARGRTLGVLTLVATSSRRFGLEDLMLGDDVACRAALAIDNARLYEQAQRAIRARQDVLATVSHDLKNPLSSILMSAAGLRGIMRRDDATALRRLETIWRAADRMDRMILDLLDLANIDAQKLAVETRPESVASLLADALDPYEELAEQAAVRLRCGPTVEGLAIECDRGRLIQVLGNLVGNAIKFTPAGGTVGVRTERRGDEVLFSVSDTGSGIAPEEVEHIFDRYWQAGATAHLGSGIGLSIVKGLVESHGGRIWVESRVGHGAAFFFTIPCTAG